ncbi:SPOR domain-containing protein [Ancylobacter lacus]|uniref:SPOR domain-containing protein n=1 Tax=Ancylobacter lacus TaxID=2579970 RepID=UPI001BCEA300|nr:SPOR domain-containing protein [Ancylobacter lacus]MBS7540877.1 D-alanyl-D-alanine carboxypeptidase [Ancylobacter lacus]
MRVPATFGAYCLRAGALLMVLAVAGAGVAEAKTTKKKRVAARPAVSQQAPKTAAASGVWKHGYSEIVVDANTGRVLREQAADELRHPASVTKVMTLYLLFEQVSAGKLRMDSELTVSRYAAAQQPSKLGVKPGSTITVEDAIKALITRSANDVAVVIAENIAGDTATFGTMMTRKARALGMSRSVFVNPNGLPDPRQVTTARDLSILARAIQERFPRYYPMFATRTFYYKGTPIGNHNRLLGKIEGVDGIKTGYTAASGFNLMTNVRRDGRHLVAVVLGGRTAASRDQQMAALLTTYLPVAYAGRQVVAPVAENAAAAASAPTIARATAPAPLPEPAVAELNEDEAEMTTAALPEEAPATTRVAAVPAPAPAPAAAPQQQAPAATRIMYVAPSAPQEVAAAPAAGSVAPIVPTPVKTIAVPRPSAPVASISGQPGTLGTLTFAAASMGGSTAPAPRPTTRPVQVASAGPVTLPAQPAPAAPAAPPPTSKTTAKAAARSGWGIQIGAFGSEEDARAHMAKAKSIGGAALRQAEPFTEVARKGSSTIVRARFAGFDAQAAAQNACKALKRGDFACMVFRN